MSPREIDSDSRKQQILAAATAVFARKGFDKASMNDIMQESGLSKGGLYWHFKSKDDIITAVVDQFFTSEFSSLAPLLNAPIPVSEKFAQLARLSMENMLRQLGSYQKIWLELYALAGRTGVFRERMRLYMNQYIDLLTGLIQAGIETGEFRPMDAAQMAVAASAQFEGLLLFWALYPDRLDLPTMTETALDLLLHSFRNLEKKP